MLGSGTGHLFQSVGFWLCACLALFGFRININQIHIECVWAANFRVSRNYGAIDPVKEKLETMTENRQQKQQNNNEKKQNQINLLERDVYFPL